MITDLDGSSAKTSHDCQMHCIVLDSEECNYQDQQQHPHDGVSHCCRHQGQRHEGYPPQDAAQGQQQQQGERYGQYILCTRLCRSIVLRPWKARMSYTANGNRFETPYFPSICLFTPICQTFLYCLRKDPDPTASLLPL